MKSSQVGVNIMALIPARGGSKSIPRKNLIPLLGRPLIFYSIECAQKSQFTPRIIVSTDDVEIAQVAREWGAEVPFMRPSEYAQDLSPDIDVFRHALRWLQEHEAYQPDLVVHLRPTEPVRRVQLIDLAITQMLQHPEADSLRSVSPPEQSPFKMWRIEPSGYLKPLLNVEGLSEAHSMPRQMLPEVVRTNSYVDIIRPRTVLEKNSMCGERVLPFVIKEPVYEIDYPEVLPGVEAALERLTRGESLVQESVYQTPRHPH